MRLTPIMATHVTKPLPALIEAAAWSRTIASIFSSAIDCFVSGGFMRQGDSYALLETWVRVLGRRDLGLLYGPHLDVVDWSIWRANVRGAETLEGAPHHSGRVMPYHVSRDRHI